MVKTGEKYAEARRILIAQAALPTPTGWVSQPEMNDESVHKHTSRSWDEWCAVIEAWPGHADGHQAIAKWLQSEQGLNGWWSQAVTIGYERIRGLRVPGQMSDGTFGVNKSATLTNAPNDLRAMLLDDAARADLLPSLKTTLRSKPTSKAIRIGIGVDEGYINVSLGEASEGRTKVTIQHRALRFVGEVEHWRAFWTDWLSVLDESSAESPIE